MRHGSNMDRTRCSGWPVGTYYAAAKARTSYFGRTDDGRDLEVVVDHGDGIIVTVIA